MFLQCFDAVGWAAGRSYPACKKLIGEVLACYLSGARCKWFAWSSWCHCHPNVTLSSLAPVKSRMVYLSGAGLPRLSCKKAVKRMYSSSSSSMWEEFAPMHRSRNTTHSWLQKHCQCYCSSGERRNSTRNSRTDRHDRIFKLGGGVTTWSAMDDHCPSSKGKKMSRSQGHVTYQQQKRRNEERIILSTSN